MLIVVSVALHPMAKQSILGPADISGLRVELGWTQVVMAQFFQVNSRSVQNWESGAMIPNAYQMAVLVRLRGRLRQARAAGTREQFQTGLQGLLPEILFGAGVFALLEYLFGHHE